MIIGKDREETTLLTAAAYGIGLDEAAEIVAIETGASDGDVVCLGPNGEPTTPPPGGTPELTPDVVAEILARPDEPAE